MNCMMVDFKYRNINTHKNVKEQKNMVLLCEFYIHNTHFKYVKYTIDGVFKYAFITKRMYKQSWIWDKPKECDLYESIIDKQVKQVFNKSIIGYYEDDNWIDDEAVGMFILARLNTTRYINFLEHDLKSFLSGRRFNKNTKRSYFARQMQCM